MRNLFLVLIFFGVCVFSVWQYLQNTNLESRIDLYESSLNKVLECDEGIKEIILNQTYKEDFYLTQLKNSTTLVLSVIGFALVFAGFFSFKHVEGKFSLFEAKNNQLRSDLQSKLKGLTSKISEHRSEVETEISSGTKEAKALEERLLRLQNDLDFEIVDLKDTKASEALELGLISNYFFYTLLASRLRSNSILFYRENGSTTLHEMIEERLTTKLKEAKTNIKDYLSTKELEFITIKPEDEVNYSDLIKKINLIENNTIFKLLADIYSLFNFSDDS